MASTSHKTGAFAELGSVAARWLLGWWRIVHLGAVLIVFSLSPASYDETQRAAVARHAYLGTAPALAWFTVSSALLSLIVIRIVLVTALSYGLSQYALEMMVRVLVLELIPLAAALFAALRCTLPQAAEVAVLRAQGEWDRQVAQGQDPVRREVMPRVVAGVFSVCLLAAVSCGLTLLLAYLSVYGFRTNGFAAYTRTVGHVFDPGVAMIFTLKILFFALAVALIPVASVLYDRPNARAGTSTELQGLVRMFFVLLLIEGAALVGNYY